MTQFIIQSDPYQSGFNHHVTLNLEEPIDEQLSRWRLDNGYVYDEVEFTIRRVIVRNSSLRVDFGWSFESEEHFKQIMHDCIKEVAPKYKYDFGTIVSDTRCSWLGFVQFNIFERDEYEQLDKDSQVIFNNQLIAFQIELVTKITEHNIFIQHSLLRNNSYRYKFFKSKRKDRNLLSSAYQCYVTAIKESGMLIKIPKEIIETDIGCHYLNHPDLFFELLEFSILKGDVE